LATLAFISFVSKSGPGSKGLVDADCVSLNYRDLGLECSAGSCGGSEDIGQDVGLIIENFEEYEMVLSKLNGLPECQQTLITFRFLSELSVAEIASVLGISQELLRSATFRGVQTRRAGLSVLVQEV